MFATIGTNKVYDNPMREPLSAVSTVFTERRLLMITDLFFLIFTFERGVFSYYNNLKLIFWASIKSIFSSFAFFMSHLLLMGLHYILILLHL